MRLLFCAVLVHLTAAILPWGVLHSLRQAVLIDVLAMGSALLTWRGLVRPLGTAMRFLPDGRIERLRGQAPELLVAASGSRDLAGFLIMLVWNGGAAFESDRCCLAADSMSPDEWRRLRRWLRWQLKVPAASDADPAANERF